MESTNSMSDWQEWMDNGHKVYGPGEWKDLDKVFDEHRERLINS